MNIPTSPEPELAKVGKDAELHAWAEANRLGFKTLDELVEREGLPLEKYRRF
jgi:post-segregation antitoxin (ccd killing protein)